MLEKTMLIKMNQQAYGTTMFQILTEDQIEQIYYAALDVLEVSGARVLHTEALQLLQQGDAIVTDNDRVRIPAYLVKQALQSCPSKAALSGRNGKRSIKLQKNEVAFGSGPDATFVYDLKAGERRKCTFADVEAAAKIVDSLPRFDFCMSFGVVSDARSPKTHDRHQFMAMVKNCTKPLMVTSADAEGLKDQWEMACLIRGGEKEFRLNPLFATYIPSDTPLVYPKEMVDRLLFATQKGIPAVYSSCSGMGVTAPATIAGVLVQTLADSLVALVLSHLQKPGVPLILGGIQTVMDENRKSFHFGSPELHLASAAIAEVYKWLKLLSSAPGGCSDSKIVDEQAASEAVMSVYNGLMAGTNLIHHAGSLEGGLTASLAGLVMCDEIIAMVKQIGKGIEVTDETLALDLLQEIGPGGEFLSHDHTFDHFRDWFQPTVIDRSNWETWTNAGSKTYQDRLVPEIDRLLEAHQPEPLDAKLIQEMKKIISLADKKEV
ncbi:MAG: trimethylamine methyltransferase family protein [Deltaproteobacteria bacterium]|jgi:trimethylamine--corrinoid protein Co-methyltransferase|nr:trimethylamine methyltransferase family protein [Deltaproteobacteria bacterium]